MESESLTGSRFKHNNIVRHMVGTGGQCVCLREQLINGLDHGGKLIKTSGELLAYINKAIHSWMSCLDFYDVPKEIIMRQNWVDGKGNESRGERRSSVDPM